MKHRIPAVFSLRASVASAALVGALSCAFAGDGIQPWSAECRERFEAWAAGRVDSLGPECQTPAWSDFAQSKFTVDGLLADPNYDRLDSAANELGFSDKRFPTGEYHFEALYLSMEFFQARGPRGARIAREWAAAKGLEGYARLAQALVYYGRAWDLRGGRDPRTLSPEAWELFYSNLELANGALDTASPRLKQTGPWHALKLSVAFDHPKYKDERLKLVKAASAAWPDYLAVYTIPMEKVGPNYGGSFELVEGVARYALSLTQATHGAAIYALAYERLFHFEGRYTIAQSRADWGLMKQGIRDLEKRSDSWPVLWRSFANMACQFRDPAETQRLYAVYDKKRDPDIPPDTDACRSFAKPDPFKSSAGSRS